MLQVSFWRKLPFQLSHSPSLARVKHRAMGAIARRDFQRASGWLLGCFGLAGMLAWNWKLVTATAAGTGFMVLAYRMQGWDWQARWTQWRRFLTGPQGRLAVAVGSGGLAALSTYVATSIWAGAENRWLAVGTILQGGATLATLLLLLWQLATHPVRSSEAKVDRLLGDLTAGDPLKRLMAVRQLAGLVGKERLRLGEREQLLDYFRLLLAREPEPAVRGAVLESLQLWERAELGVRS